MGALSGVGRIRGVTSGQFQAALAVEIGGLQVHVATDCFLLGRVLGVDVMADFRLEVRGHLGTTAPEFTLRILAHLSPCEAYRWHRVCGETQEGGDLLAIRGCSRSVGALFALE